MVKIENLPHQARKDHIARLVGKRLKESGQAVPADLETASKIIVDMEGGESTGIAWFSTDNKSVLIELLKLHKKVWIKNMLKTFLMGFTYDDTTEHDDHEQYTEIDKWCRENPDYELMIYRRKRRLEREGKTPETAGAGAEAKKSTKQKAVVT